MAIDDGGIGSREMDSGDISVQHKTPGLNPLFPNDTKEQNQGASRMKEDESENGPDKIVTDQSGSPTEDWFQKAVYPTDNGRHQMQISTSPEDPQIESTAATGLFTSQGGGRLLQAPTRMPGSDRQPGRKAVPSDEGGLLGIDDGTGTSMHVVDPDESEKPIDNFKGSAPASNTRRDWRATTSAAEIFAPVENELFD